MANEVLRILFVGDPEIKRMLDALAAYYHCSVSAHIRRLVVDSYRATFDANTTPATDTAEPAEA